MDRDEVIVYGFLQLSFLDFVPEGLRYVLSHRHSYRDSARPQKTDLPTAENDKNREQFQILFGCGYTALGGIIQIIDRETNIDIAPRCERTGRPAGGEEFIILLENKLHRPLLPLKPAPKFKAKTKNN